MPGAGAAVERREEVGAGSWKNPGRRGEAIRGGARPKVPSGEGGGGGAAGGAAGGEGWVV